MPYNPACRQYPPAKSNSAARSGFDKESNLTTDNQAEICVYGVIEKKYFLNLKEIEEKINAFNYKYIYSSKDNPNQDNIIYDNAGYNEIVYSQKHFFHHVLK